MPTDMPERGRSQVHIQEVVRTHAAATGTLADFRQRHSPRRIGNYLRFRLGCSTLPVVMGRRDSAPRHLRHCQQCGTAAVGDENSSAQQCSTFASIVRDLFWDGQSCASSLTRQIRLL